MQGSVRKRQNGKYEYTVFVGYDENGKRKRLYKGGFDTKKDCQQALNDLMYKLNIGEFSPSALTMEKLFDLFLDYKKETVKIATYNFYKNIIEYYLRKEFKDHKLEKMNQVIINDYIDRRKKDINPGTLKHVYNVIKIVLTYALKQGFTGANIAARVKPLKVEKTPVQSLNEEELSRLLNYTKKSNLFCMYIPILLSSTLGLRRGEVLGLRWSDIKKDKLHIINNRILTGGEEVEGTTKTKGSSRVLELSPFLLHELQWWRSNHMIGFYVCTNYEGIPLKPDYVTKTLPKLCKRAGVKEIRFHDLRHTCASILINNNVRAKVIQELLGHTKISTTLDTYSHISEDNVSSAVNKIEQLLKIES